MTFSFEIDAELNDFSGLAPIFPLPSVVLFPHALLPLHIFESRYRQMTADALDGERLIAMFRHHLEVAGIAHKIVGDSVLFDILFTDREVKNYRDVVQADLQKNIRFNAALRANGVFKPMGKVYVSLALTEEDFALTDHAIEKAAAAIAEH